MVSLTARRSQVWPPAIPGPFCGEFACSPCVCMGLRPVLQFPTIIKDRDVWVNASISVILILPLSVQDVPPSWILTPRLLCSYHVTTPISACSFPYNRPLSFLPLNCYYPSVLDQPLAPDQSSLTPSSTLIIPPQSTPPESSHQTQ